MNGLLTWAYANVLGNLVASAIWAIPAAATFAWHHRHINRRIDALHDRLDGREGAYQHHLRRLTSHILDTPPHATTSTE